MNNTVKCKHRKKRLICESPGSLSERHTHYWCPECGAWGKKQGNSHSSLKITWELPEKEAHEVYREPTIKDPADFYGGTSTCNG